MFSYHTKEKERTGKTIQPKLKIGLPGDKYEREADAVAERVMRMGESETMQMQPNEEEEEVLQPKLRMQPIEEEEEPIQMKCDDCQGNLILQKQPEEEEELIQPKIQMQEGKTPFSTNLNAISSQSNQFSDSNTSLPDSTNHFMSNAFNADFSGVKIHTDNRAINLNKSLHSRAFVYGPDIYFNKGEYKPYSSEGKRLLAHELTHTVQQGVSRKAQKKDSKSTFLAETISSDAKSGIQRLIKPNHPWTGTVVDTHLLALRDAPGGGTLADLPDNTLVNVVSNSSGWLNLEVDVSQAGIVLNRSGSAQLAGNILDGFSYHRYIDDAAAAEMSEMVGEQARWVPSGPTSGNTFQTWASAASESAAPPVTSVTTINCWEMVLMAAFRIGAIDWQWIHDLYTNSVGNWYDELPNRMTSGGTTAYDLATQTPLPVRGDIVFFDGASHVALATGNGDEILTFWPPPNTSFTAGGTVDDVKLSTIEILSDWMTANLSTPTITFGSPAW